MAAAMASRGVEVIGVDTNSSVIESLNTGRAPVQETFLEETIAANRERLRATSSYQEAILSSDITFVAVPTPSDDRGAFSLSFVEPAFREIGQALKMKSEPHLVVLVSTVLPGSTRSLLPVLESESGKRAGEGVGLCYSPQFIALGSVLRDFLNADFTLIGEHDHDAGARLESFYNELLLNNPPCRRISLENAELAKIALNNYVIMKMTFANMLADLCEVISGGDVDVVSETLGLDRRIGGYSLKGGLGYGGPCFPRDTGALSFMARELGIEVGLVDATDSANRSRPDWIVQKLQSLIGPSSTVGVLGLAYKPSSHIVEESQALMIARALAETGARVVAYDPLANESARAELPDEVTIVETANECVELADVVVIATPDPAFRALSQDELRGKIVVDCWRLLADKLANCAEVHYLPIGRNLSDRYTGSN
jgi:UDPglucose 6-dehydrogenase